MPTLAAQVLAEVTAKHGKRLADVAGKLNVTEESLLHLGLDPAFTPDTGEIELLRMVAASPLDVASCYPTAKALYPVIADPSGEVSGGSAPKVRFKEAGQVRTAVAALVDALDLAVKGGRESVFRVELAGHGFTLVVRKTGGKDPVAVELIETIANAALITPSLSRPAMSPDAVAKALRGMVDDDLATRRAGAKLMGWDADDFWLGEKTGNDPVFPEIEFRWWSSALRADAVTRWVAQFTRRLDTFAKLAQVS